MHDWHLVNLREVCAIIACLIALAIAGITWERRAEAPILPAFGKPICPIDMPLAPSAAQDI